MTKINILRPNNKNLSFFLGLGSLFFTLSIIDFSLNNFFDKNITFFLPRYINFFGSENVKVLPFELFLNDKKTYFQELNHFIFNTSDYSTLTQLPRINKSKEKFWRKNALTFIHQYYQHANRDLYEKILDIKSKEANYLTKYEYF